MSRLRLRTMLCAALLASSPSIAARADGVSAIKACEADTDRPEDTARLTILPNGESRGSDTAADLIAMARQKAKARRSRAIQTLRRSREESGG